MNACSYCHAEPFAALKGKLHEASGIGKGLEILRYTTFSVGSPSDRSE